VDTNVVLQIQQRNDLKYQEDLNKKAMDLIHGLNYLFVKFYED